LAIIVEVILKVSAEIGTTILKLPYRTNLLPNIGSATPENILSLEISSRLHIPVYSPKAVEPVLVYLKISIGSNPPGDKLPDIFQWSLTRVVFIVRELVIYSILGYCIGVPTPIIGDWIPGATLGNAGL
jgi:hypothetical protein